MFQCSWTRFPVTTSFPLRTDPLVLTWKQQESRSRTTRGQRRGPSAVARAQAPVWVSRVPHLTTHLTVLIRLSPPLSNPTPTFTHESRVLILPLRLDQSPNSFTRASSTRPSLFLQVATTSARHRSSVQGSRPKTTRSLNNHLSLRTQLRRTLTRSFGLEKPCA